MDRSWRNFKAHDVESLNSFSVGGSVTIKGSSGQGSERTRIHNWQLEVRPSYLVELSPTVVWKA